MSFGKVTVHQNDGSSRELQVRGPGGVVRLCVGSKGGAHASVWRIWSNKTTSDIYVAVRDIAGYQKWSLHQSGDWRNQWISEDHARQVTNSSDRVIDRWSRPGELEEWGWTKAFYIRVRPEDLVDYGDGDELPNKMTWLSPPPDDRSAVVHVIIADADRVNEPVPGVVPVDAYGLANGQVVLIVASLQAVDSEEQADIDRIFEFAQRQPQVQRARASRITASVVSYDDETRGVWDLAVPVREPSA